MKRLVIQKIGGKRKNCGDEFMAIVNSYYRKIIKTFWMLVNGFAKCSEE